MSAGTAYSKRYAGGFADKPSTASPIDSTFLNAVEVALLQLIGVAPTVDGQVAQWDNANTRFGPALILNKNVDPSAAIAKSKLDLTGANGIVNADVATAAAIAYSKLNLASSIVSNDIVDGTIVNADINAAAAIVASKLASYPSDATKVLAGDGSWPTGASFSTQLITEVLGNAGSGTLSVTGIPSTYKYLYVEWAGRTSQAATTTVSLKFNNDATGSNHVVRGGGSDAYSTSMQIMATLPGSTLGAPFTGGGNFFIQNYNQSTFQAPVEGTTTGRVSNSGTVATDVEQRFWTGLYGVGTPTVISRVDLILGGGNWVTNSFLRVYGVK